MAAPARTGLIQDRRFAPLGLEPAVLAGLAGPAVLKPNDLRGPKTKQPCSAYALHVAGDIVSGGLDVLGNGHVIAAYRARPEVWPRRDLAVLVRLDRQIRRRHGLALSFVQALRERLGSMPAASE